MIFLSFLRANAEDNRLSDCCTIGKIACLLFTFLALNNAISVWCSFIFDLFSWLGNRERIEFRYSLSNSFLFIMSIKWIWSIWLSNCEYVVHYVFHFGFDLIEHFHDTAEKLDLLRVEVNLSYLIKRKPFHNLLSNFDLVLKMLFVAGVWALKILNYLKSENILILVKIFSKWFK